MDECSTPANTCRYACKNLVGSFMCVCPEGYVEAGRDQCRGKSRVSCMVLSCQPRVLVTLCFVYKVIRDLESIDHFILILFAG